MPPHILLLNGPAGVGKTTVARQLAALHPGTVRIEGDALRGFAPAGARTHLGPGSTYRAGAALAASYLEMGASRVIFDYLFPSPAQVAHFQRSAPAKVPLHLVTLWAPLEIVRAREGGRPNRLRLGARFEPGYRAMEANLGRFAVVSTADLSPKQVAARVQALVMDGGARLASEKR